MDGRYFLFIGGTPSVGASVCLNRDHKGTSAVSLLWNKQFCLRCSFWNITPRSVGPFFARLAFQFLPYNGSDIGELVYLHALVGQV